MGAGQLQAEADLRCLEAFCSYRAGISCLVLAGFYYACTRSYIEAGCSQEEGPKKGFVMGSRTRGVQETLEKCI